MIRAELAAKADALGCDCMPTEERVAYRIKYKGQPAYMATYDVLRHQSGCSYGDVFGLERLKS